MKLIPILYSTPMVQAISEDRKTKTRRLKGLEKVNENPDDWMFYSFSVLGEVDPSSDYAIFSWIFAFKNVYTGEKVYIKCPYGQRGDVLWVREKFRIVKALGQEMIDYAASPANIWSIDQPWKPSIHMPKKAARLFLKVKDIRVQRLKDISQSDAIAEGVEQIADYGTTGYKLYTEPNAAYSDIDAVSSFESLWESINGKASIELNPWVWVIDFKKIDKPENFLS